MRALGLVLLIVVLVIGWSVVQRQGDDAGSTGERGGVSADDGSVSEEQGQRSVSTSGGEQVPGQTESDAGCGPLLAEELGLNVYQGAQLALPGPAGPCELSVVHGDITGTGACHIRLVQRGEAVGGLSQATWKLVRVRGGTREQQLQAVEHIQRGAAQWAGGSCPEG